jgi:hypothetical protein
MFGFILLLHSIITLNVELNPICHLLALLGAHRILHVSRIRVKATQRYHLRKAKHNVSVWLNNSATRGVRNVALYCSMTKKIYI